MPSENTFKSYIDLVRKAYKNFEAIKKLDVPSIVKTASDELIESAVGLVQFIPYFNRHPLFLEMIPKVHSTLDDYFSSNPAAKKPPDFKQIIGLKTGMSKENMQAATSTKRGTWFPVSFILFYQLNTCCIQLLSAR